MKWKHTQIAAMALAGVLTTSALVGLKPANAATITNNVEIDLSLTSISSDGSGGQLLLGTPATLVPISAFNPAVGDILQTTVSFKNGDRLKVIDGPNIVDSTGPQFFEAFTFYFDTTGTPGSGSNSTTTTGASYVDLLGNAIDTTGGATGVLGQGIGGFLSVDLTDSFISFTGLTVTTTIVGLATGGDAFDRFGLFGGRAGGFEVIAGSTAVPLPAALPLLLTGLTGLGFIGWRRRQRT